MHRGVYVVGHRRLRTEGRLTAALLYAGRGAALSHGTGLWWWGLQRRRPRAIHVSVPGRRPSANGVVLHHPLAIPRVFHERLPVTTVERTIVDFAATARFHDIRRVLAEAEYRMLLDVAKLEAEAGRGRPGSGAVKRALAHHQPRFAHTRSDLEEAFVVLCEEHGLPMPQVNVWVAGFLVDALWPAQRLTVEVDGGPGHSGAGAMEDDRHRDLVLREHGYLMVRYTWRQVTTQRAVVARDLVRALGRNGPTIPGSRGEVAEWLKALAC